MVLLNDVDFIVSAGLAVSDQYANVIEHVRGKRALVLPALEPKEDVVGIGRGIQQTMQAVHGAPTPRLKQSAVQSLSPQLTGRGCFE